MKKLSHLIILAMIAIATTAFVVAKHKKADPVSVATPNLTWFNTIEIAEGITVEFEYGSKLEVVVEGNKELVEQLALRLENQILRATGKSEMAVQGVKIRVITPVLINLAARPAQNTELAASIEKATPAQTMVQPLVVCRHC